MWAGPGKRSVQPIDEKKEPGAGISLLLGILLLVSIYGVIFLIAYTWQGNAKALATTLGLYQVGSMFVITLLALAGLSPEKRGFLRGLGIFVLSIVPVLGWIVLFWAGKGLARNMSRGQTLTFSVVLGVIVLIVVAFLGNAGSGFSSAEATPTSTLYPTRMPNVYSTLPPTRSPSVLLTCTSSSKVYSGYSGCVYGVVNDVGYVFDAGFSAMQVSLEGQTAANGHPLVINVKNPTSYEQGVHAGNCVMTSGTVSMNKQGTHLFVEGKLSSCVP